MMKQIIFFILLIISLSSCGLKKDLTLKTHHEDLANHYHKEC